MAQKLISLNESDLKRIVKNVILEYVNPGFDPFADDDPDMADGGIDMSQYDIPDIKTALKGKKEYQGEYDANEFQQEDPDDVETKLDADVNNSSDRDVNYDDEETPNYNPSDNNMNEPEETPITPLSQHTDEPVEQHQEGDVIYYENTPIEFKNGQYHMTIEDGFDLGSAKCPKITVVGSNLNDVKEQYNDLWDGYYYKEHGEYVKQMQKQGLAEYDFDMVGNADATQLNLEDIPVIINLDKQ